VHGKAGQPASRLLIAGIKGSRAPFSMLEPLILHDESGQRTEMDEAIARGRRLIAMG
jgi:tRNA1(Val) A37 N6-methylase TrmN6